MKNLLKNRASVNQNSISETDVVFLLNEQNEDLFAYFPNENYDSKGLLKTSYSHIGQHSACSPEYAAESRKATQKEYEGLKQELEQIGYLLNILN